jgi:hypothetical protein
MALFHRGKLSRRLHIVDMKSDRLRKELSPLTHELAGSSGKFGDERQSNRSHAHAERRSKAGNMAQLVSRSTGQIGRISAWVADALVASRFCR